MALSLRAATRASVISCAAGSCVRPLSFSVGGALCATSGVRLRSLPYCAAAAGPRVGVGGCGEGVRASSARALATMARSSGTSRVPARATVNLSVAEEWAALLADRVFANAAEVSASIVGHAREGCAIRACVWMVLKMWSY